MSKKRTRHIRVARSSKPISILVVNMKTRKFTWDNDVTKATKILERTDGNYNGNELDGEYREFIERALSCKAYGFTKVVVG
jgi:hypothetical protein